MSTAPTSSTDASATCAMTRMRRGMVGGARASGAGAGTGREVAEIRAGQMPGGQQARHEADRQRTGHGERQRRDAEVNLRQARKVRRRDERQASQDPPREDRAARRADRGKQDLLEKERTNQSPSRRAQREANRDFAPPGRAARDEQARQIHAGGDEHDRHADHQRHERRSHARHDVVLKPARAGRSRRATPCRRRSSGRPSRCASSRRRRRPAPVRPSRPGRSRAITSACMPKFRRAPMIGQSHCPAVHTSMPSIRKRQRG